MKLGYILGELIYDKQIKSFKGNILWQDGNMNLEWG